jgi:Holliday junction resolvase RusA-like endonuclease
MSQRTDLPAFAVVVHGTPAPQGSKRALIHSATGRPVVIESSKKARPWRDAVRSDALNPRTATRTEGHTFPLDGPLHVDMIFTFMRPRSHYRTGRNSHLLRDGMPCQPAGTPDLSKLARSTEDALTEAAVWRDDARVVEYGRLAKVYAGEDPDALTTPGVVIRIWPARSQAVAGLFADLEVGHANA